MSIAHCLSAYKQPFFNVTARRVPGYVNRVPKSFNLNVIPHMRLPGRRTAGQRIALYRNARNSKSVHYSLKALSISAAYSFAVYKRAVCRADIRSLRSLYVLSVYHVSAEAVHGVLCDILVYVSYLSLDVACGFRCRNYLR